MGSSGVLENHLIPFIFDEFLQPVNHKNEPILIEVAHIAGSQPSLRIQSRGGCFGITEITCTTPFPKTEQKWSSENGKERPPMNNA